MEKYKRFTDPATGLNAFVGDATIPPTVVRIICGCIWLVIAAVPLLIASALLWLSLAITCAMTAVHLAFLARPLHWAAVKTYIPVILGCVAWGRVVRTLYPAVKSTLSTRPDAGESTPEPGDVIMANCQSPLDVLVLQAAYPRHRLSFVFPSVAVAFGDESEPRNDTEALTVVHSLLAAMSVLLSWTTAAPTFERPPNLPSTRDFDFSIVQRTAEKSGVVLVVFGEGATTNGRGVLSMPRMMFDMHRKVHIAAISYSNPKHPVVLPYSGSLLGWLLLRCIPISFLNAGAIEVAVVRPSHIPPLPSSFSREWSAALQARLALAASFCRPTDAPCRALSGSSATDKRLFLAQWLSYNNSKGATTEIPVAPTTKQAPAVPKKAVR